MVDDAGVISSVSSSPIRGHNMSELLNGNSNINGLYLLESFTNDEVESKFRSLLPSEFDYFHTSYRIFRHRVLDEDIPNMRNHLIGLRELYDWFPILRNLESKNYKFYDYLMIEHVFKDPMFICCFSELVHLSAVVPDNQNIVHLCADFVISIFEKRDLAGMKGRLMELNPVVLKKACHYLKKFKMLSICLIKYYKQKIINPKSDERWRKFYKRHDKKLKSYGWENEYQKKYLFIKKFVGDPIFKTALFIPNGTCVHCFGSCRPCPYTQRSLRLQN